MSYFIRQLKTTNTTVIAHLCYKKPELFDKVAS